MRLETLRSLERDAVRVLEIVRVLAKYGLADWLADVPHGWLRDRFHSRDGQALGGLTTAARFRLALTELGPTFIKLGQILSTRADLVGPEFATELAQLQAGVPADAPEAVRALVQAELGRPPEEVFLEFEPAAFASASIAQVHRARLATGEAVVVKVQHAGIAERIRRDLDILVGLGELAERHARLLRPYQPAATARQFRRTLLRELDFHGERRNLATFAANFAGDATVHFPAGHPAYSTRRVLTMERLAGVPGTDEEALRAAGTDLGEFARRGALMYLRMIFRDGFYHADPHPGNLMLLPGNVVGVLDCGMIGRLDEGLRGAVEDLLLVAVERDAPGLTDVVLRLGNVPPTCRRDELAADITDFLGDYVGATLADFQLGAALDGLTDIIRRHEILLPPPLALLLKVLVMLEGTSRRLDRDFSLAELMQPFYLEAQRERLAPTALARKARRMARDWWRFAYALPCDVSDLLLRARRGEFTVRLEHHRIESTANRVVAGVLTAALIIGSSLLWSTKAPPTLYGVSVVGALGYACAAWLGWRVLRAIHRSGDLRDQD